MADKIRIDGTIQSIVFLRTRNGHRFARVLVASDKLRMDVEVFGRRQVDTLLSARRGDRLKASGQGFHRGPLRSGSTSLTAERITLRRDEDGRNRLSRPQQLDLFAA